MKYVFFIFQYGFLFFISLFHFFIGIVYCFTICVYFIFHKQPHWLLHAHTHMCLHADVLKWYINIYCCCMLALVILSWRIFYIADHAIQFLQHKWCDILQKVYQEPVGVLCTFRKFTTPPQKRSKYTAHGLEKLEQITDCVLMTAFIANKISNGNDDVIHCTTLRMRLARDICISPLHTFGGKISALLCAPDEMPTRFCVSVCVSG